MNRKKITKKEFILKIIKYHNMVKEAMEKNNYRKNNQIMKKRNKLIVDNQYELFFSDALLELMQYEDIGVSLSAATQSLKYNVNIDTALKILNDAIVRKDIGISSLEAEMTLKVYNGQIPNKKL